MLKSSTIIDCKKNKDLEGKIEKYSEANAVIELEDELKELKEQKAKLMKQKIELEVEADKIDKNEPETYDHYIEKIKILKRKREKLHNEIGKSCIKNNV